MSIYINNLPSASQIAFEPLQRPSLYSFFLEFFENYRMVTYIKCLPEVKEYSNTELSLIYCFAYKVDYIKEILLSVFISLKSKLFGGY